MSFSVGSYIALHSGTWYNWECIFLECLRGGQSMPLLLTDTLPWEIYTSRRVSLCQSSRLSRLRCCTNMSPALDVCLFHIHIYTMYNTPSIVTTMHRREQTIYIKLKGKKVTYLAALRWTLSILLIIIIIRDVVNVSVFYIQCMNTLTITLLYNDFIVNIYTIGLGTSFYNLLVPLHTNTLIA
jgi:hypothetical protein